VAFTKLLGRHTINVGYEQYFCRFGEHGGDHTGTAWINPGGRLQPGLEQQRRIDRKPACGADDGIFELLPVGNWNITPFGWNQASYAMNDWKVNSKLTVQLGARWDHDGGRQGRNPQGSLMYDINAKNVCTRTATGPGIR